MAKTEQPVTIEPRKDPARRGEGKSLARRRARGPRFITTQRSSELARRCLIIGVLLFTTGCLHHHYPAPAPVRSAPSPQIPAAPIVQGEEGIASWYGPPFNGRRAASGEIYNMYDMTAAHRTLPFGTQVRVHNLDNGRQVDVRINDRGPFWEGRIIDLSYAAAQAMGMSGIAHVRLEILGLGVSSEPAAFAVQVGAFRDPANADRLRTAIGTSYGPVVVVSYDRGDGTFYRVRVGQESSEDGARVLAETLRNAGLAAVTFVVRTN